MAPSQSGRAVDLAPEKTSSVAEPDTASELIEALDNLLLERAVREHREALSRLNTLKMALRDEEDSTPEG